MIQVTTLEGRKFFRDSWGMTMTSRNAYDPTHWIVLEDKGATCVIAELKNGEPQTWGRTEWTREQVERQLKSHSLYKHEGEYSIQL